MRGGRSVADGLTPSSPGQSACPPLHWFLVSHPCPDGDSPGLARNVRTVVAERCQPECCPSPYRRNEFLRHHPEANPGNAKLSNASVHLSEGLATRFPATRPSCPGRRRPVPRPAPDHLVRFLLDLVEACPAGVMPSSANPFLRGSHDQVCSTWTILPRKTSASAPSNTRWSKVSVR